MDFDFFLFDFDGLLVNTEELHFQAYRIMLKEHGVDLDWSFNKYCSFAHVDAVAVRNAIYKEFPKLFEKEPDWSKLHKEKSRILLGLLNSGSVRLMDGVEEFLLLIKGKNSCVVTNSPKVVVDLIKDRLPVLKTIPHWVTRECYVKPKPDPESYRTAVALYAKSGDRIVAFEDTRRGLDALKGIDAKRVLICAKEHPQMQEKVDDDIAYFESFRYIRL